MQYMRNRYYDPATGKFTQQDPIGLAGGMNLYGFASGDPVNFSDPMGLNPWPLRIAVALASRFPQVAAFTGLASLAARFSSASELADDAVIGTMRLASGRDGPRIFEIGRRIGEFRVGQEKAVKAIEHAVESFAKRGPTVSIEGTRYLTPHQGNFNEGVNAIAVGKDGATSKALIRFGEKGWELLKNVGPIPVAK